MKNKKQMLIALAALLLLVVLAALPRKRDGEWYFVGQTIRCTAEGHCDPCTLGAFGIEQASACPR